MGSVISGFSIRDKLHSGPHCVVYRAARETDNLAVILKLLNKDNPSALELSRFRREHELTRKMNGNGAPAVVGLERYNNALVIVEEDMDGIALSTFLAQEKPDVAEMIIIAIRITECLEKIHQQRIIHKNINPSNIIWNSRKRQAEIVDFGISAELSSETPYMQGINALEGTLSYMSPEQTGRMNRSVDYRTDMYSLGVTLYVMFTGNLPFASTDPVELVHCHIARRPTPPHELNHELPPVLSGIIMKLMAKTAEDRYQSAYGLKIDLEMCLENLMSGHGEKRFDLGQEDIPGIFRIPQKLYGREREMELLLSVFERISGGRAEILLVSGYAGIGKTAFVHEIQKYMMERRGHFIEGKFDQLNRNIPYASLIQAFQSLIRQLLTDGEGAMSIWKEKLLKTIGLNGRVVIDVIPEVEVIIGPQPPVPDVPPAEAQHRFRFVFQNFMRIFATKLSPLVIFLDDLQWADLASLQLIEYLMSDPETDNMMFIGAYRDTEVNEAHPLSITIKHIEQAVALVSRITLPPLALNHANQLIAESLLCKTNEAMPLTELCYQKTRGNPFLLTQFLQTLYGENLLEFDRLHRCWRGDIARIQDRGIPDNVVEFMVGKIQKLPLETRNILKFASCIGNQFDLATLSIVSEQSAKDASRRLWPALEEGFVVPVDSAYKFVEAEDSGIQSQIPEYRFLHDRVQQAAYSLIEDNQKQTIHLLVGRLLLSHTLNEIIDERIFEIVNHFNLGFSLPEKSLEQKCARTLEDKNERARIAELNLTAGLKALTSAAYEPALRFFKAGIACLEDSCWQTQYPLALSLYSQAAEAAYLTTDFEEMDRLAGIVLQNAHTVLDTLKIYESRIRAHMAQHQLLSAVQTGVTVLGLLGQKFPAKPRKAHILMELLYTKVILSGKKTEDFLKLPAMTDQSVLAALRFMAITTASSYWAMPMLYPLMILRGIQLSLRYGNTPLALSHYNSYGVILCGVLEDFEKGYQFGQLGLRIMELLNARECKAHIMLSFNAFIKHWKDHLQTTLDPLLEAYQTGLETGDLEYAGFSAMLYCHHAFYVGLPLAKIEKEMAVYRDALGRFKQEPQLNTISLIQQATRNLMGADDGTTRLVGHAYNEDVMLPRSMEAKDKTSLCNIYIVKAFLGYLFDDSAGAFENIRQCSLYLDGIRATYMNSIFRLYDSLIRIARLPALPKREQKRFMREVAANQKKLKKWAHHAPMNSGHKWLLVEAERARAEGRDLDAMKQFKEAARLAGENGFIQEEALANELAGKFYSARGDKEIATVFLKKAHHGYAQWGAVAKVTSLEAAYPEIASLSANLSEGVADKSVPGFLTVSETADYLDLMSITRASQAISGEIILKNLMGRLMKIVVENAGAQSGVLLIADGDELVIQAKSSVEGEVVTQLTKEALISSSQLPLSVVNNVKKTGGTIVLKDAFAEGDYCADPYIVSNRSRSVLCLPIIEQTRVMGALYLENNLSAGIFTQERLQILTILSSQVAISLKNALNYEEIKRTKEEYYNLFENIQDMFYRTDGDGRLILVSPSAYKFLGYEPEELINSSLADIYAQPEERQAFLDRISEKGYLEGFETILRKKDGSTIWISANSHYYRDAAGNILGVEGMVRDITERKQVEVMLLNEKERLSVTLRSIGDGVIATDTEGCIALINRAAEDLTGWTQEEALGRNLQEIFHVVDENTRERRDNPLDKVSEGGTIESAGKLVLISRNGTERLIGDSFGPIRDKDSGIVGAIIVFRDITEKRKLDLEILKNQKLESIGLFAGGIAHDFNNILTGILGNISLAKMYAETNDKVVSKLTEAEKASGRAKELTQQLLTFSKGGSPIKKITSIDALIRESAQFFLSGSKVKSTFSFPEDIWPVDIDEGQINQVVNNLIINAIQAMPGGGMIHISAGNIQIGKEEGVPLAEGPYVKISIKDEGTGIAAENLPRIFDPFFTTKHRGNGLGLATAYSIIRKHDGHTTVESAVGRGTTFHLYLPASQKQRISAIETKAGDLFKGKGRALIMDDEEMILEIGSEMLKHLGFEVVQARDGVEAVELYKKAMASGLPFNAVIMDLTIPGGMGGKEAVSKLKEIDPEVKAVVSSGYSNDPIMAEFRNYGFVGRIVKPYKIEEFAMVMQNIIN